MYTKLGDMDDEEESAMASADDQRESDFQVLIAQQKHRSLHCSTNY